MSTDGAVTPGLRTRAGNTMSRTRDGLLDGALSAVERSGARRLTMSAVAQRAGVAKATLYNHFRTKHEVLVALVDREVRFVAQRAFEVAADGSVSAALDRAAADVGEHIAARRVAETEPEALRVLLTPSTAPTWSLVRTALADLLGRGSDPALVEVTLAWLVGQLAAPQEPELRARCARMLADVSAAGMPGTSS